MAKWTLQDVEKFNAKRGKAPGKLPDGLRKAMNGFKRNKVKEDISHRLHFWTIGAREMHRNIQYFPEHMFHPTRKWRFDFAILVTPRLKIAIEYEGVISEKSRHTTIKGFTEDACKYNEAAKFGWIVLRYTALNYKNLIPDLNFCLNAAHFG